MQDRISTSLERRGARGPPPAATEGSFLLFSIFCTSVARSCSTFFLIPWSSRTSKYFFPSTHVCSHFVKVESGLPLHMAKSASLPASSEPTLLSILSCLAGFDVTKFRASSSEIPYSSAFAASQLRRVANWLLSELNETTTPCLCIRGPLPGIASHASIL